MKKILIDAYELLNRVQADCDECAVNNHDPLRVRCSGCRRGEDVEIIEAMIEEERKRGN